MSDFKWTQDQERAIVRRNDKLLVAAAAGSGKTAVLVERILRRIMEDRLSLSEILVLTFTKAAAKQMRDKLANALQKALKKDPRNSHLARELRSLPSAPIQTLHSFAFHLIKEFSDELGLDPSVRIGGESELRILRETALGEIVEEFYEEGGEEALRLVEALGSTRSDQELELVLRRGESFLESLTEPEEWRKRCISYYETPELFLGALPVTIGCYIRDALQGALSLYREIFRLPLSKDEKILLREQVAPEMERLEELLKEDLTSPASKIALLRGLQSFESTRWALSRNKQMSKEAKEMAKCLRDEALKILKDMKKSLQMSEDDLLVLRGEKERVSLLLEWIFRFRDRFREKRRERNLLNYSDLEVFALSLLYEGEGEERRYTSLAGKLQDRYREVMVDEYQDSNDVQEAMVNAVSEGGSLFLVGDVKQSIYLFRNAKPNLFLEKYDSFSPEEAPEEKIELRKNFRTEGELLHLINEVFYHGMHKSLGGIEYTEDVALSPGRDERPEREEEEALLELLLLRDKKVLKAEIAEDETSSGEDEERVEEDNLKREAAAVASRVAELLDPENGFRFYDEKEERWRLTAPGDIFILLRAPGKRAEEYRKQLLLRGIPCRADSKTGFYSSTEVQMVLNVLRVLDNPLQDIPFLSVLRSPFYSFTEEELLRIQRAGKDAGSFYRVFELFLQEETKDALHTKARKTGEDLKTLRKKAAFLPVSELLDELYEKEGFALYMSALPPGEQREANLSLLRDKAEDFIRSDGFGLFSFVRSIDLMDTNKNDEGEAEFGGRDGVVRILSIHKSKGLEIPVVFLSSIGTAFNLKPPEGGVYFHSSLGLSMRSVDTEKRTFRKTFFQKIMNLHSELEIKAEECRILYTAMTRAKEKLILTGVLSENPSGKTQKDTLLLKALDLVPLEEGETLTVPDLALNAYKRYMDYILRAALASPLLREKMKMVLVSNLWDEKKEEETFLERKERLLRLLSGEEEEGNLSPLRKKLRSSLEYSYPLEKLQELSASQSVTGLKKKFRMEREEETVLPTELVCEVFPEEEAGGSGEGETLEGEKALTEGQTAKEIILPDDDRLRGAERGTAIHSFFEHLPFNIRTKEELDSYMNSEEEAGYLRSKEREALPFSSILRFLNTDLAEELRKADKEGRVFREEPFLLALSPEVFSSGYPKGDSKDFTVIRGICDLILLREDAVLLLDYKSDSVRRKDGREVLRNRYRLQMTLYAEALRRSFGKPVDCCLYSTALSEFVFFEREELEALPVLKKEV